MTQKETIEYVKALMKNKDQLPFRIDIYRNANGIKLSEELYKKIVQIVKDVNLQLEAEIYLNERIRTGISRIEWFLRKGDIYYDMENVKRKTPLDQKKFFERSIPSYFTSPGSLPIKFNIEFDKESQDLASRISKEIKKAAKKFGVEKFIEIELKESAVEESEQK